MGIEQSLPTRSWRPLLFAILILIVSVAVSFIATSQINNLVVLLGGMVIALIAFARPDWGVLLIIVSAFVRVGDVSITNHNAPALMKYAGAALCAVVLAGAIVRGQANVKGLRSFWLVGVFLLICTASLMYADNVGRAQTSLFRFYNGVIVAITIALVVRREPLVRTAVWALLISGLFLGGLSSFQFLTSTFRNAYGGFAQAVAFTGGDYRSAGPIGDPNYFGQIMLMLVPLAFDRIRSERAVGWRVLAGIILLLCILSITTTFSRGAFLGLVVVLALIFFQHRLNPIIAFVAVAIVVIALQLAPERYTERVSTLLYILPGSETDARLDASFQGRLSENIVAILVWRDHPLLGVGLNNFTEYYQRYSRLLGIDPRREDRAAHNLYLQVAAELGTIGLIVFLLLIWQLYRFIQKARLYFGAAKLPESARLCLALITAFTGYLITEIFLQFNYPVYFFLLIGFSVAVNLTAHEEYQLRSAGSRGR